MAPGAVAKGDLILFAFAVMPPNVIVIEIFSLLFIHLF